MTAYSAGLRVSELVNLKIADIDAARMTLRVKRGKGGKDRYAILSQKLLVELRRIGNATGLPSGFSRTEPRTVP
jgi:integrase/recombinase XerD